MISKLQEKQEKEDEYQCEKSENDQQESEEMRVTLNEGDLA